MKLSTVSLIFFYFSVLFHHIHGNKQHNIGIGLTTIPPRFTTVYHVIKSWLEQNYPPTIIVLFIPEKYQNFIGESKRDPTRNIRLLNDELMKYFPMEIQSGKIIIQSVKMDYGPITKYLGLFEHYDKYQASNIDYWVIGDDDVHYAPITLSDYMDAIDQDSSNNNKILTHFKVHPRITAHINHSPIRIQHLQGVDTILFPSPLLSSTPTFYFPLASMIVLQLHSKCPESFYQDDYVISFLISLSHAHNIQSIWNGKKVAHHVNGVSKSGQQMHIHRDVFHREEITKQCITNLSNEISQLVENYRNEL